MRTCMVTVLVVMLAGASFAQGFIPKADQEARKRELAGYASRLLDTKDSHDRVQIVKDMVEKDAIKDATGKVLGDGFAVDALSGLYKQGLQADDVDARLHAVIALGSLNAAPARDALVEALNSDPTDAVQLRAILAIENAGYQRAGKDVLLKVRSANPEVAGAAARCLAVLGYDPQNQATGPMIELMAESFEKLRGAAEDDPGRPDLQRLIEILGQSTSKLVPTITWAPGQGMDDLGREIGKFTAWWNARFLGALRDTKFETRRDALSRLARTADRSTFGPVLDAVLKEVDRLAATENFPERPLALQFVADGSAVLSRISGLDTCLRLTSTADEMKAAVKQWQDWLAKQPK